jgi:hypothetical protein
MDTGHGLALFPVPCPLIPVEPGLRKFYYPYQIRLQNKIIFLEILND